MKWWDQMPWSSFSECWANFFTLLFHFHQGAFFLFAFCHVGGVICISEVIDISPGNLDSNTCYLMIRVIRTGMRWNRIVVLICISPNEEGCWVSFHVPVGYLYVFFETKKKMSIHILRLFSNWMVWFFDADLNEFFIYFGYWLLGNSEGFPGGSVGKESACNAGGLGLIPGLGRSPGKRNGNPLQYSCLENSMDRRVCQATVHGVRKQLDMTEYGCTF